MGTPKISLEFLTEDECLREFCRRYWAMNAKGNSVEPAGAIARDVGVPRRELPRVLAQFCTARLSLECPTCSTGLTFRNRSDAKPYLRGNPPAPGDCESCLADQRDYAAWLKAEEEKKTRGKIAEAYDLSKRAPADPYSDSVGLREALYFMAMVRLGGSEESALVASIAKLPLALTPGGRLDVQVVKTLFEAGLLVPDPTSPLGAFVLEDGEPTKFRLDLVSWVVPGSDMRHVLRILEARLEDARLHAELEALWNEIAAEEVLEFLQYALRRHGMHLPDDNDRIRRGIAKAVGHDSVAAIFKRVWIAAEKAVAWARRKEEARESWTWTLAPQSLGSATLTFFERSVDEAIAKRWRGKPGWRNDECPQSKVSKLLSVAVAGDADAIFYRRLGDVLDAPLPPEDEPEQPQL